MKYYNERELYDGIFLFSETQNPSDNWGLHDGTSILIDPEYKYDAYGTFNNEPAVMFSKYDSKKIYYVNRKKLLFSDKCKIVGTDWNSVPEIQTNKYGNLYYVVKDSKYCLVNESEKVVYVFENDLPRKIKAITFDGEDFLLYNGVLYDFSSKRISDQELSSKIVDAFTINGWLFYILRSGNLSLRLYQKGVGIIGSSFSDNSTYYAYSDTAFYILEDANTIIRYDESSQEKKINVKHSGLIKIGNKILTGDYDKGNTIDLETGYELFKYIALKIIPGSSLLIITDKGNKYGIYDFEKNRLLAPSIFSNIIIRPIVQCEIQNKLFEFDIEKKEFKKKSRHSLIAEIFE